MNCSWGSKVYIDILIKNKIAKQTCVNETTDTVHNEEDQATIIIIKKE